MQLKPQDVYVVLKIVAGGLRRAPYSVLAAELGMSPSEVHACVRRAQFCGLLHDAQLQNRPNLPALEEFLVHGLRYVFPAERGPITRGVPTSYATEPLRSVIGSSSDPIPVWPYGEGTKRGAAFAPLYKTAPMAALRDSSFHEYLALADALREGRVRERTLAAEVLHGRFQALNATRQS
jgi:hypothetical protein